MLAMVASGTRGPQFEFIAYFYNEYLFTVNFIEKIKIKKKRLGMAHSKNNISMTPSCDQIQSRNIFFVR